MGHGSSCSCLNDDNVNEVELRLLAIARLAQAGILGEIDAPTTYFGITDLTNAARLHLRAVLR